MAETHHRVGYDTTIDDAVDVGLRLANRSQAFRKQISQNVVIAGVLAGAVFFGGWIYFSGVSAVDLAVAACGGAAFGAIFSVLFKRLFMKEMLKQHRKITAEQFGGKPTMPTEVELRSDAVWVRQGGLELTFPWTHCTDIQDNADDVELDFSLGICVVRNRDFPSRADRQAFLETARRLAGK
jgi:hypothetical protein